MDDRKIVLVSNDSSYLKEQLETEGLIGCIKESPGVPRDISDYGLLILNKIVVNGGDLGRLVDHVSKGNNLIIIRPCRHVEKILEIDRIGFDQVGLLHDDMSGSDYQVYDIVRYEDRGKTPSLVNTASDSIDSGLVFQMTLGAGNVVILAFDFSRTVLTLLQGREIGQDEKDDFGIQRIDFGRTVDRNMRFTAQVDGLRRMLVGIIEAYVNLPLPKIWYFPHGHRGGLIFTHDSDGAKGDEVERVHAYNNQRGLKPTTFMKVVDGNPKSWRRLLEKGFDLQLHPVISLRLPKVVNSLSWPFGNRIPASIRNFLFSLQKKIIEVVAGKKIIGMRTHGLAWPNMTAYLLGMARSGIAYDSTFGSNRYFGYMYGTGLPYYLRIPGSMESLDIVEFPLHIMDSVFIQGFGLEWREGEALSRISQFISQAIEENHSLITLNFHYFFMLNKERRTNNFELYQKIVDHAVNNDLFIANMTDFNVFWRKRNKLRMTGPRWDNSERKLSFELHTEADINGLTYLLPVAFNNCRIEENNKKSKHYITLNGKRFIMYEVDLKASSAFAINAHYSKN
jgi:hypothetical protein